MSKVTKRDGRIVQFDKNKIIQALEKAFVNIDGELTEDDINKINAISTSIENENKDLNVEDIQDIIDSTHPSIPNGPKEQLRSAAQPPTSPAHHSGPQEEPELRG